MAEVQYHYVQRKKSESGQTGTATYDLPESGFIPEIVVRAFSTPTASTNPALPLNDAITKIEIVDGAEVIKSLDGNQVRALQMIHDRKSLVLTDTDDNAAEGYGDFKLIFAKKLNGTSYCPDFSRFANPQIKISWDYSATSVKGASYDADASPAMKFTILAKVVRGAGHGYTHGYLKSSSIKTITQAASTTSVVEIPRGEPLVGIMVDAGYDALDFTEDVEKLKLDFDNGAWVPMELYEEEVQTAMDMWFNGPFSVKFRKDLQDSVELDTHMGYVSDISILPLFDDSIATAYPSAPKGIETVNAYSTETPAALAAYSQFCIEANGFIPFNCFYVPMGAILNGMADTVDTTRYGRVDLELTSGASASTSSRPEVIAEYLIK